MEELKSIHEIDDANPDCKICKGEGWVCESHPKVGWNGGDGCCGGAGAPCSCNPLKNAGKRESDTYIIPSPCR